MKTSRLILTLCALLLALGSSIIERSPLAAQRLQDRRERLTLELRTLLQSSPPDAMINVIVYLKEKEKLRDVREPNHHQRVQKVINKLQRMATRTQKRIRQRLQQGMRDGTVANFQTYWIFNGLEVTATGAIITELATFPEVEKIALNGTLRSNQFSFERSKSVSPTVLLESPTAILSGRPEPNLSLINAPALWDMGWTGQGIVVATMDTGVDISHPDLAIKWRGGSNSWFDPYGQHPSTPVDLAGTGTGHGTWTMGVMVGGRVGGTDIGVAPDAQWIAVKIFNDQGSATVAGIHDGFQWLLDPDGNPNTTDAPHVVNNSWTFQNPGCDLEFQPDLQALRAAGILPIFAGGNSGPNLNTSMSPANNPDAFAVGSVNNSDAIYVYSSRGPSTCGGQATNFPHVVAPGVSIFTSDVYGLYTYATGTSIAAPHVSGGLALLLNAFPNLVAAQQEAALLNSTVDLGPVGPDHDFGHGRMDLLAAHQWLTINGNNQPPIVNAGNDITITLPSTLPLSGVAIDDGLPTPALVTTTWTVMSGPGVATFGDVHLLDTTASFDLEGIYTLRLTADDGQLSASDSIVVTVQSAAPTNLPPTVSAGVALTITLPAGATLSGAASDDGLPAPSSLTTTWSVVSGPGAVTFDDIHAQNITASFSIDGVYTLRLTADDGQLTASDEVAITVNPQPMSANIIYVSSSSNGKVGGVSFRDEDIVAYDPGRDSWALFFDGSDVGLAATDINAFTLLTNGSLLLGVDSPVSIAGLGIVDDSDIVQFFPTSYGTNTAGSYAFYLQGANVGLTTSAEDIDAIDFAPDGRLLISTLGNVNVPGVSGKDEDLLALDLGSGIWSLYFDGSAVGLTLSSEDVWGLHVNSEGLLYLSTSGNFSVNNLSGSGSDSFACAPLTLGENNTSCTYTPYWIGAEHGFGGKIIDGLSISGNVVVSAAFASAEIADNENEATDIGDGDPTNGDADESDEAQPATRMFLPMIHR